MPERKNLTAMTIRDLPFAPEGKRLSLRDAKVPNLELRITSKKKTFYCTRWSAKSGFTTRIRIGDYPALSVEQARKAALEAALQISRGADLSSRQTEKEITFGEVFTLMMETEFQVHCKPKTCDDYQWLYKSYLSSWEKLSISRITKQHIYKLHASVGKDGKHRTANRILVLLSSLYNKGMQRNLLPSSIGNLTIGIKRYRERSRDRFLQTGEIGLFFKAVLEEQNETMRDYFLLSLLTGVRKGNLLSMRWTDIDLDSAVWSIKETKNGSPQRVVLVPEAASVLKRRLTSRDENSPFVFPAISKSGHIRDPKSAWKRILKRAKLSDLRIHDLRRTFGSWQATTGSSLVLIGKSLNHKSHSSTQIYARLDVDPVRQSVQKATTAMLDAARSSGAEIHALRTGGNSAQ